MQRWPTWINCKDHKTAAISVDLRYLIRKRSLHRSLKTRLPFQCGGGRDEGWESWSSKPSCLHLSAPAGLESSSPWTCQRLQFRRGPSVLPRPLFRPSPHYYLEVYTSSATRYGSDRRIVPKPLSSIARDAVAPMVRTRVATEWWIIITANTRSSTRWSRRTQMGTNLSGQEYYNLEVTVSRASARQL